MANGYNGKILRVDLTRGTTSVDEPGENFYRQYLGGSGFINYFLLKELKGGEDPLGPENKLIFATGPVTGVPIAGSGRNNVAAKSPLTNGHGSADVGGFWSAELKFAGYDAIIVDGKAKSPVYLWIEDGNVEIKDAAHLWGKTTGEVQKTIQKELGGGGIRVCQIGMGGENGVRYACIVNDINHAAGRSGIGAVMGSKMLRAIAVRGHQKVELADPRLVSSLAKSLRDAIKARSDTGMSKNGTLGGIVGFNTISNLPTRNFKYGQFEGIDNLTADALNEKVLVRRSGCYACPLRCKPEVAVADPYNVIPLYGGPEYETMGALGSNCGIDNLEAICKANQQCGAYGIDTIGTGDSIAFAMECFENGILTEKDTGGLKLNFGNVEAMLQLVEMIARKEGIGELLAEGTARAAKEIGKGAEEFAMQVKGQELPMHEPRCKQGLGLGYTMSPTGADHCHNIHDHVYSFRVNDKMKALGIFEPVPPQELSSNKVKLLINGSLWQHVLNSLVFCQFIPFGPDKMVQLVNGITGWNTDYWELMKVGERCITMSRAYNNREGMTKADDWLPKRFLTAFDSGPLEGVAVKEDELAEARDTYYAMVGWDNEGKPTRAKLQELGIEWVADA